MKKILIFGSSGLLGSTLKETLKKEDNYEIITNDFSDNGIDITKKEDLFKYVKEVKPDWLINCAAFTDVEACEDKKGFEIAKKVNGLAPGYMADVCKEENINFVHISTDYVFSQNKAEGYEENFEEYSPMNAYGKTKMMAEKEIAKLAGGKKGSDFLNQNSKFYIIRTQWLFGNMAKNFIAKITKFAKEKPELKVVDDEFGCPTYVKDLSKNILFIIENEPKAGFYHSISDNSCSRYDFAKEILKAQNIKTTIKRVKLKDFPRKAHISNYSILKNTKFPNARTWEEMIEDYFADE